VIKTGANDCESELRKVPETIKRSLKIHLVETADEVLRLALLPKTRKKTR
jgi:ATP-dependent Lon protease